MARIRTGVLIVPIETIHGVKEIGFVKGICKRQHRAVEL
jgi:hypothetical protein